MHIRILKFGGTSLSSPDLRRAAVSHIQATLAEDRTPVVVVSAMGRKGDPYATDTLLNLVLDSYPDMPEREVAMLAGCGEIISAVVLASACLRAGVPAIVLTGAQAGIRATNTYVGAAIQSIDPDPLTSWISRNYVPVVAGFQGAMPNGEVAILDRGGSDTSSVAIGYALAAEQVDIFTDVQGILTADPRIIPDARLIDALTFEQALLMASHGTKAIHPDAVKWAMRGAIPIHIRSINGTGRWTCIGNHPDSGSHKVLMIACQEKGNGTGVVTLIISPITKKVLPLDVVRATLHAADIPLLWIELSAGAISLTLPLEHMTWAVNILHTQLIGSSMEVVPSFAVDLLR